MRRRSKRGHAYSLAATVIHMCVMTPGPVRSASTAVSPGSGRLLSSLLFRSALLLDERKASKSRSCVRRIGSSAVDICADDAWGASSSAREQSAGNGRAKRGMGIGSLKESLGHGSDHQ